MNSASVHQPVSESKTLRRIVVAADNENLQAAFCHSDNEVIKKFNGLRRRNRFIINITCNKNAIPNDPQSPFVTSGLRLGTPAATTRGFDAEDMDQIAEAIALTLKDFDGNKDKAMAIVKSLTDKHPLYE